ncbi:MAG: bifunctional phosphopantothenoylcysteine decarboxylase/phosphopantothenate--cysteine ligase CoaBC [Thermodesulfovibrionales bacterium]
MLAGKSLLVGVTGSVAAYKSVEIVRGLKREGASVWVIMTEASSRFVTPLSLELASGGPVFRDIFDPPLSHTELTAEADLFIVAPATANIIGKYSQGIADDLLSASLLAYRGKLLFAPAMNWRMYENPVVRRNLDILKSLGVLFVGPEEGDLACGEKGMGRMSEPERVIEAIQFALTPQDLAGERVLVTAGPTREYLDPIRFISNRSSGKMGYAVAKMAQRRGAEVTLISGPVSLRPPDGIGLVTVDTAEEMRRAVMDRIGWSTVFVMSAAVADFSPGEAKAEKVGKTDELLLQLKKTRDILAEVGKLPVRPFVVGFSAETGQRQDRARRKLREKGMDMIVFNDVTRAGAGFDVDTNEVMILREDREEPLPLMSKDKVASAILDRVREELKARGRD